MPKSTASLDRLLKSHISNYSGWFSPTSFHLAFYDWQHHLLLSPDKKVALIHSAIAKYQSFFLNYSQNYTHDWPCLIPCQADDERFKNQLWRTFPFNMFADNFLICEQLWDEATSNVAGVSEHHANVINFMARLILDIMSPSNYPLTNPEVLKATYEQKGNNFIKGWKNYSEDLKRTIQKTPPYGTEKFKVGVNVAITPGKVIYRNRLIELIQYSPTTTSVDKEPILIVPAWIMKYYILDLSPNNSMVKYLVAQGHTVFIISWKNPTSEDRDLGMDDYLQYGVLDSLGIINQIIPNTKINATGYCIGGTLLMIAAAYMAKLGDDRLNTITLFAAQIDFKDAGELLIFIDESQINYLENIMWEKGYLDGSQMAGTFSMLHPIQLIWSRVIREYLLGVRDPIFDLMAWDYDTTRLPYRMHSEYLRKLFLNNELIQGKFVARGEQLQVLDIDVPMFVVSTITDHVAPWESVYKVHLFTKNDITFVLTQGGHNAGIVSEPGHPHRAYQLFTTHAEDKHLAAHEWQEIAPSYEGSWWPDWHAWLEDRDSTKEQPPTIGNPTANINVICDAPGTYVLKT